MESTAGGKCGLVLAGGGARAAYQVGVLKAVREILPDPAVNPFPIICGTSAGAVNAGSLAVNCDDFGNAVEKLLDVWNNFQPHHVYRADWYGATRNNLRWMSGFLFGAFMKRRRSSLLDNRPLEALLSKYLDFIPRGANLVFIGNTGVGKTGLASAILLRALQRGYRGLFIKAQDLFDDMYKSLADHSSRALLDRLMRVDLLLIDEMGYLNLRPEQSNIFFKLMEERYGKKATIITTNLEYEDWYGFLGQKEMVGALLDRLRHRCHTVRVEGQSLREPQT